MLEMERGEGLQKTDITLWKSLTPNPTNPYCSIPSVDYLLKLLNFGSDHLTVYRYIKPLKGEHRYQLPS